MNDVAIDFENLALVDHDTLRAAERFLYREARLLAEERQRKWLTDLVHPDIRYQVFTRELRSRKDKRTSGPDRTYIYDEGYKELDARVRQFETGMQWRTDPPERLRYLISNIEAHATADCDELSVLSNCLVVRNRRVYEESHFVYGRRDILRRSEGGDLQLLSREVDYDQRFVEGRNLLFFL